MNINEAEDTFLNMSCSDHDVPLLIECVNKLEDKPEILIKNASLLSLYWNKISQIAVYNILTSKFDKKEEKVKQLELLSSRSYSSSSPSQYLPYILNGDSIVFEIDSDSYGCYELLLTHMPEEYSFLTTNKPNNKILIVLYKL
ncbi:MAG: hypothetical protein MJ227_02445 [Bacilli bacterium]|nr:hypothetical protein [Bacilli bacterium]